MIWANLILITAWWLLLFQFIQRLWNSKKKTSANKKHPECIVWRCFESEQEFNLVCKRESLLHLAIYGQVFDVSAYVKINLLLKIIIKNTHGCV